MSTYRLDKYLAECGLGSRSDVKNYIKKGKITVDGKKASDPGLKVSKENVILFDGNMLSHEEFHYFMLNKPQGVVSATEDNLSKTVIDLLKDEKIRGLFPVGRLDKDTEGLLLITDDGELSHNLLSPRKHVEKTYYVIADKEITPDGIEKITDGIDIGEDKLCKPALIESIQRNESIQQDEKGYHYNLTITEGKFHQVKRMFAACGSKVIYLKRMRMGNLVLDENLAPGEYRKLSEEEIKCLKQI